MLLGHVSAQITGQGIVPAETYLHLVPFAD